MYIENDTDVLIQSKFTQSMRHNGMKIDHRIIWLKTAKLKYRAAANYST